MTLLRKKRMPMARERHIRAPGASLGTALTEMTRLGRHCLVPELALGALIPRCRPRTRFHSSGEAALKSPRASLRR
jgi:hypothetical protein